MRSLPTTTVGHRSHQLHASPKPRGPLSSEWPCSHRTPPRRPASGAHMCATVALNSLDKPLSNVIGAGNPPPRSWALPFRSGRAERWRPRSGVAPMGQHTVVLLSGGIDSSATIALCQETSSVLSALFVDYGQPSAQSEWEAAQRIARHYQIEIVRVALGVQLVSSRGEFFGRNALLLLTAAGTITQRPLTIALGIHALSAYYDTTPLFIKHMQRLLNGYSGGSVTLSVPFLGDTKSDVIRFARARSVPLHLTYSCELQNAPACAECPSCRNRITFNGD